MGTENIEKIKEDVLKLDNELDEYEKKLNIYSIAPETVTNTANKIVAEENNITKYGPEECIDNAYKLAQQSFYLQKEINKQEARIHWINEQIGKRIQPRLGQQVGTTFEERKLRAISENDLAAEMQNVKNVLERRVKRISYLSVKIDSLKEILMMIYNRRKNNG